jgi:carbon monoxide dehydrogenase subunit G
MQLDSTFSVFAPIDKVWNTLMDFERVAGCLPGSEVLAKLSDDAYTVGMKVKLGPVTLQYKGQLNVIERDADKHRAVLQGKAQETRGQGTAQATVTLQLSETDGTTEGTVSADLTLSGKAAAMGKSIIGTVADQMMALFAANLQAMVAEPAAADPLSDEAARAPAPELASAPTLVPEKSRETSAPPAPGASPTPSPSPSESASASAGSSLNGFALAKGVIAHKLSSPATFLGLLAAVAFIAYKLGRKTSQRHGSHRA